VLNFGGGTALDERFGYPLVSGKYGGLRPAECLEVPFSGCDRIARMGGTDTEVAPNFGIFGKG